MQRREEVDDDRLGDLYDQPSQFGQREEYSPAQNTVDPS